MGVTVSELNEVSAIETSKSFAKFIGPFLNFENHHFIIQMRRE